MDQDRDQDQDQDGEYPQLFDASLADIGIEVVLTGIRMPGMHAITERWARTCRRALLHPPVQRPPLGQRETTHAAAV
ncbi:hypothetical protein [Streptomyces odontomachi]|uniref:hypothetical protein n=1 Tax=Streptomyces odontomachi TaxID=2944940 RepID=UPI0027E2C7E1|nr:hypothetical protein [Streptomyces sp. ODS25]